MSSASVEGGRSPQGAARRGAGALLAPLAGLAILGCGLLGPPPRTFRSHHPVLESIEATAGYRVDPERFELLEAEVREDSVALVYRGVQAVGDRAWVVLFSQKSTEQDPFLLESLLPLAAVLEEGRSGFRLLDDREVAGELPRRLAGASARYVRYGFESPVHDERGAPLPAHGILARVTVPASEGPVHYQIKLDNHGDREAVEWEDLAPLIEAIEDP